MNPDSKHPIQVEDLLRLKRAERPPAEFWTEFDRQLRAKQLAAIVEKRPWWHSLPQVWRALPRITIPLGAATVLMVTYVSMRDGQRTSSAPHHDLVQGTVAASTTPAMVVAKNTPTPTDAADVATEVENETSANVGSATERDGQQRSVAADATPAHLSTLIPLLGASAPEPAKAEMPMIAAPLVAAQTPPSRMLPAGFLRTGGLSEGHASFRQPVEPLQQITPPSERLRARLLTAMVSLQPSDNQPRATGTRAATQISEENLYDTTHRFGARGAGVVMKF